MKTPQEIDSDVVVSKKRLAARLRQKRYEERHPDRIKEKNRKRRVRYHMNKSSVATPNDDLRVLLGQKLKE